MCLLAIFVLLLVFSLKAKTFAHAELINSSLALFIKDLFAVIHPAHAARLSGTYIRALRKKEDAPFEVSACAFGLKPSLFGDGIRFWCFVGFKHLFRSCNGAKV